jgi:hypothetical protein
MLGRADRFAVSSADSADLRYSKQYQPGGSVSLTWQTTNATDISINGVGAVQVNGSQIRQQTSSPDGTWDLVSFRREEKARWWC